MLVSCIMPTCDRQVLIPVALKCYLSQDWPDKELVVIDDGAYQGNPGHGAFLPRGLNQYLL